MRRLIRSGMHGDAPLPYVPPAAEPHGGEETPGAARACASGAHKTKRPSCNRGKPKLWTNGLPYTRC